MFAEYARTKSRLKADWPFRYATAVSRIEEKAGALNCTGRTATRTVDSLRVANPAQQPYRKSAVGATIAVQAND
jgi:hypothetical protein